MDDERKRLAQAYADIRDARMNNPAAEEMASIIERAEEMPLARLAEVKPEVIIGLAEEISAIEDDEF